jgi:hypothetical protein
MSEGFPKSKSPEQQLAELKEIQRALAEVTETGDAAAAEAFMAQYRYAVEDTMDTVESSGLSPAEAERLFGKDFLGSKKIENVFGVLSSKLERGIPFSKEELERAKELGQQLILQNDFMDVKNPETGKVERNVPVTLENLKKYFPKAHDDKSMWWSQDWYKDEDFFKKEKPRTGWRLTSKELVPDSTSKNYLEQTDVLVDHLQKQVFKGAKLSKQYEDAITEFKRKRAEIEPLAKSSTDSEWKRGSQMLADLTLTKLTRELPVEVMYRLILNDKENADKLLPSTYTWTTSRDSDGDLVYVGTLDARGADVHRNEPRSSYDYLGVSFSRS